MNPATSRAIKALITERGWLPGSDLEDRACRFLHSARFRPGVDVVQQHRVGPYRLDFAFLDVKVALEVDGHRHLYDPQTARKDAERDAYLRGQGWVVCRVDAEGGADGLEEQICRVCSIVNSLRRPR